MIPVSLVLPEDYELSSVATVLDVFDTVNRLKIEREGEPFFKITLVESSEQRRSNRKTFHGFAVKSTRSKIKSGLVLIPAIKRNGIKEAVRKNLSLIPWLKKQFGNGAEIASFCTGAFLFAESGLLNGRLATTHVSACADLILSYPLVFVKPGRTLTVDWNCYTSGGATSAFHLLVYLIQKFCGNEMAIIICKEFSIELDRYRQSYFSTFRPVYSHNDDLVSKIQKKMEADYLHINCIEEVTQQFPASRRNIFRRFVKATGVAPLVYLQNIRIEKAKGLLETTDLSVSEIIRQTGYADSKSFRKIFLKLVGIPPVEYRSKFSIR